MNKETITIEIPVLDTQESFDLVNTFNEEQMKYVAVICKGYEKEVQKANKQKEVLDKIKEYCKNKIEEQKNMTDFSKYYLENYDKAINIQHLSHSGVMLETIKSTTIKRYEDILELLEEIE